MSHAKFDQSVRDAGAAIGEAIGVFMLHPETFAGSIAAGYENPFAGYVAGRGGVLGEATGTTVSAVFAIFEPNFINGLLGSVGGLRPQVPCRGRGAGPNCGVGREDHRCHIRTRPAHVCRMAPHAIGR